MNVVGIAQARAKRFAEAAKLPKRRHVSKCSARPSARVSLDALRLLDVPNLRGVTARQLGAPLCGGAGVAMPRLPQLLLLACGLSCATLAAGDATLFVVRPREGGADGGDGARV